MAGEKQGWSFSAVGNPEDLQKMAFLITPSATPLLSAMGDTKKKVSSTKHEWTSRTLRPAQANKVIEGATITAVDPQVKTRMYNYTQLSDNPYFVTDTENAIAQANGTNSDIGSQMRDAMLELRRDVELAITTSNARVQSASGTAGQAGGLPFYLNTTNFTTANMVDAANKGLSEGAHVIPMAKAIFSQHDPENLTLLVSPYNKIKVDGFTGGAMKQVDPKTGKIYNNIKGYSSSFGDFAVMVSRYCPDTDAYLLDMNYLNKGFLQDFQEAPVTSKDVKTAHKEARVVWCEWTAECLAVEAHAHTQNLA